MKNGNFYFVKITLSCFLILSRVGGCMEKMKIEQHLASAGLRLNELGKKEQLFVYYIPGRSRLEYLST